MMNLKNIKQGEYISEKEFDKLISETSESFSDPYFEPEQENGYTYEDEDILHKMILKDIDEEGDTISDVEIIIIEKGGDNSKQKYFIDYLS